MIKTMLKNVTHAVHWLWHSVILGKAGSSKKSAPAQRAFTMWKWIRPITTKEFARLTDLIVDKVLVPKRIDVQWEEWVHDDDKTVTSQIVLVDELDNKFCFPGYVFGDTPSDNELYLIQGVEREVALKILRLVEHGGSTAFYLEVGKDRHSKHYAEIASVIQEGNAIIAANPVEREL